MESQGAPYPGNDPNTPVMVIHLPPPALSHEPTTLTCPHCRSVVTTAVEYENSSRTHLSALLLCLLCGIIPGLCPYCCCSSCQTAVHTCPVCRQTIGTHEG